jgi:hypothetical protein
MRLTALFLRCSTSGMHEVVLLNLEQTARIENRLPAYTLGSLTRRSQMEVLLVFIKTVLENPNSTENLKELAVLIDDVFLVDAFG